MRFILIPVLLFPTIFSAPVDTDHLLQVVLPLVSKGLDFFSSDYSEINVDGLFGLRLGQGQIVSALEECRKNPSCPKQIHSILEKFQEKLDDTCKKAMPYVEQGDETYYNRFVKTINQPYSLPYQPIKFDQTKLESVAVGWNTNYKENTGDDCYAKVFGTYKEKDGSMTPQCTVTPSCWKMMTDDTTAKYSLTHQLLYFIVIENVGCQDKIQTYLKHQKIRDIQTRMCRKIYKDASSLVINGKVTDSSKDLFLEQSVLCGILGYEDFMSPSWIQMTSTWPDKKEGCFKLTLSDLEHIAVDMVDKMAKEFNITDPTVLKADEKDAIKTAEENYKKQETLESNSSKSSPTMRKLLREKGMKDHCLAHTSGLGFGVFCNYLRYLVRYM